MVIVGVGLMISFILTGSQWVFGSVPLMKYSYLVGQPSQGREPVRVQMPTLIKFWGVADAVEDGFLSRIVLTILAQIGEAPVIPEAI